MTIAIGENKLGHITEEEKIIAKKSKWSKINKPAALQNTKINVNSSSEEKLRQNLVKNKSLSLPLFLPSSLSMYNEKIILDYENLIISINKEIQDFDNKIESKIRSVIAVILSFFTIIYKIRTVRTHLIIFMITRWIYKINLILRVVNNQKHPISK
jgi:hypothetical protein